MGDIIDFRTRRAEMATPDLSYFVRVDLYPDGVAGAVLDMDLDAEMMRNIGDPDLRVMRREKVNYAQRGGELLFRWFRGSFVLPDAVPEDERITTAQVAQDSAENERFMRCLAAATIQKRAVGHVKGINYYATIFTRMTEARGMSAGGFERAFERLLHIEAIELDVPLWKDAHYHWKTGIRATGKSGNPLPEMAEIHPATPRQPHPATPGNPLAKSLKSGPATPVRQPPPYTTYMEGEPLLGASPSYGSEEPPAWMDEAPPLDPDAWKNNPILNGGID